MHIRIFHLENNSAIVELLVEILEKQSNIFALFDLGVGTANYKRLAPIPTH